MSFTVESASLEPKSGNKFIAGGEDMWVHVFDFVTGEEISKSICFNILLSMLVFNSSVETRKKAKIEL